VFGHNFNLFNGTRMTRIWRIIADFEIKGSMIDVLQLIYFNKSFCLVYPRQSA